MMKDFRFGLIFLVILCLGAFTNCKPVEGKDKQDNLKLWYKQPAVEWLDALPIGNGRIGAMVFGGVEQERLALNISTLWSGAPSVKNEKPTGAANLEKIKSHIFKGENKEAEELCAEHLIGNKESYGTHLPMGNLLIDFSYDESGITEYHRELDINSALSSICFIVGNVTYTRESFATNPDNLILLRFTTDKKNALNFNLHYDGGDLPSEMRKLDDKTLLLEGDAFETKHSDGKSGVHFCSGVRILKCDGAVEVENDKLRVKDASEVVLCIASNTNYIYENPLQVCVNQFDEINSKTYSELKQAHVNDYQKLFKRTELQLGEKSSKDLPTDERLQALKNPSDDPELYALYYNYSRYLLIAGSRGNSPLPTNLQGIWNDNFACKMPWTCDFHFDINTQQNYWLTESGNLSESHQPLFKLIEDLVEPGKRTAEVLYDQEGWVAHVFSNAWGFTAPGWGLGWGLHVTGGAWVASHLWTHYEYTLDEKFLADHTYPVLKEAAVFFKGYLTKHPNKEWLVSGPSISPENKYFDNDGNIFSETMGATCDAVLIRDLFNSCIEASEILDGDEGFRRELIISRDKLQPLMIGKHGQLQEWLEDYEDAVPNHRHTTHLIALYPSSQITPGETPELAKAAKVTIERRLAQSNWEDVEWSRGNFINFYARLLEGDEALKHLHGLIIENSSNSMLAYSRGGIAGAAQNIFSIDGNFAGGTGISEMLVQSYNDKIYVLPALPESWNEGDFKGVCTRNGFELNLVWKNGELERLEILSKKGQPCNINYKGESKIFTTEVGQKYVLDKGLKEMKKD